MFYYFFLLFLPNYCGFKIMSYLCTAIEKSSMRPDGGIGRRAGLKHQWIHFHPGSTPGLGTARKAKYLTSKYLAFLFARFFPTFSPQVQNKWL